MIIQTGLVISHVFYDICKLIKNVLIVLLIVKLGLILHVKGLSHVHAIQPYLFRINLLMPEISLCGTRLRPHLTVDQIDGFSVLLLTIQCIQCKQGLACVYIVDIVLLHGIPINGTILMYSVIDICIRKIIILFLAGRTINLQKRQNHTSVNIIPP